MDIYQSKRWRRKRDKILRRDGYVDQVSKRYRFVPEPATHVHHIFPRDEFPEYQWEDWNLISVSMRTHNTLHDRATGKLTNAGRELMHRTARKMGAKAPNCVQGVKGIPQRQNPPTGV